MHIPAFRSFVTGLGLSLLLATSGCGGGGGGGSSGGSEAMTTISGTANKGVLIDALVSAYSVANGVASSTPIATASTDNQGRYTLSLGGYSGPVLIVLTPKLTTKMRCDIPAGCDGAAFGSDVSPDPTLQLQTVVSSASGNLSTALTPYTTMAAEYAKHSGGLTPTNITSALYQVAALYGLPDLNATQPVDITASDLGTNSNAQHYAVMNAAIGQLATSASQIQAKINQVVAELNANSGQLVGNSSGSATVPALADILSAAKSVGQSSQVGGKLLNNVVTTVAQNLLIAQSLTPGAKTTISATTPNNASDLVKARSFISNAHNMIGTIQAFQGGVAGDALRSKYQVLQPFTDGGDGFAGLSTAMRYVSGYIAELAGRSAESGVVMSASNADFQKWLDDNTYYYSIKASGFSFNTSITSGLVTVSCSQGSLSVQPLAYQLVPGSQYNYQMSPKGPASDISVGEAVGNLPVYSSVAPKYSVRIAPGFSMSGNGYRLVLQGSAELSVMLNGNAQNISLLKAQHAVPDQAILSLKNVELDVGAVSNGIYPASFRGDISLESDKVYELVDPGYFTLMPSLIQFNGLFSGLDGDSIKSSMTAKLVTTGAIPVVPAMVGSIFPNLFTYSNGIFGVSVPSSEIDTTYFSAGSGAAYNSGGLEVRRTELRVALKGRGVYEYKLPSDFDYSKNGQVLNGRLRTPLISQLNCGGYSCERNMLFGAEDTANFAVGSVVGSIEVGLVSSGVGHKIKLDFDSQKTGYTSVSRRLVFSVDNSPPLTLLANNNISSQGAFGWIVDALALPDTAIGKADYSISDSNGVMVRFSSGATQFPILVTPVSSQTPVQQGLLANLNGVFVARFSDNSILSL